MATTSVKFTIHNLDGQGNRSIPTITPTAGFSASADADRLHKAIKGIGTDESALIKVLARRTNLERQEICKSYKCSFKSSLRDDIRSDTSREFCQVLCLLVEDVAYVQAKSLYYAMKDLGTSDRVLIQILTSSSNDEVKAIDAAYTNILKDKGIEDSKRSLIKDLKNDTSGDYKNALLFLCNGERDDLSSLQIKQALDKGLSTVINKELAKEDAKVLHESGVGRTGTCEERITRIICNRTPFQLNETSDMYKEIYNKSLLDDLKCETSMNYETLLLSVLKYATCRSQLLAEWLYDSMKGFGTNDYRLMRLLITRAEIDLQNVKQVYQSIFNKSLAEAVKDDTSGSYRQTLLTLMNESTE